MAEEKLGVVAQHRKRLEDDPEYRAAALTAPSITEKRGIHEKVLPRTVPTALSSSPTVDADDDVVQDSAPPEFDVDGATKAELLDYADHNGIEVKKSAKVDEIRKQVKGAV